MGEPRGFDLDGQTSRAWTAFTRRLADRLAEMSDGDTLSLQLGPTADHSPGGIRVVFTALPESVLRRVELTSDDQVRGEELVAQREADQLAAETVRLVRDVHGAMHPAFLSVSEEGTFADDGLTSYGAASDLAAANADLTEPSDAAHLLALALESITTDLGHEPTRDADGDIVFERGTTRVFVRVLERTPVVQIFSRVVHDITNLGEAPAIVASLNESYPFVKFLFADSAVFACVHVPASPFVPAQLRHMMATFAEVVERLDGDLVRQLGGEREIEEGTEADVDDAVQPEGVPPELMTLVRLDPEGQGLDSERTAEVCSYDRALTRQLLHIAVGQEEVWLAAAEQSADDPVKQARCAEEAAGWSATRRSLAGALELIDAFED